MHRLVLFSLGTLAIFASAARAGPTSSPAEIIASTEGFYANIADLSAKFSNTYFQRARGTKRVETGRMFVRRPRQLRMDYLEPRSKFFVFDGSAAWFFVVDDAQVILDRHFATSRLSRSVSFLWGEGELAQSFALHTCDRIPTKLCRHDSCHCIKLEPKAEMGEIDHMYLSIDENDYQVHGVLVVDPLGNETGLRFEEVKTNQGLEADWFVFTVPPGVSVLERGKND